MRPPLPFLLTLTASLATALAAGCATGNQIGTGGSGAGGSAPAGGSNDTGGSTAAAGGTATSGPGGGGSAGATGGGGSAQGGSGAGGSAQGGSAQGGSSAGGSNAGGSAQGGSSTTTTGGSDPGHTCGNLILTPDEQCESNDLAGQTCQSLGFEGGTLDCAFDCTFDTSGCHQCGNGTVDVALGEECDFDANGDPLVLTTCAGLGYAGSNDNPGCDPTCHYDTDPCLCGNGAIDPGEICDGADFGGLTCASFGFSGGALTCTPDCEILASSCNLCGNGALEPGEACDDGNTLSGDGCSATCQPEVLACDPDGTYTITQGGPIAYSCCGGLVSVNVSSFILTNDGASILSSPSNPAPMSGAATTCPAGTFSNTASIPGGCTETYSLTGSFTGPDTWTGQYALSFTGPDCSCFGGVFGTPCIGQVYSITAQR